ncbi:MAG: glycosyltransferase [Holosporaceae bacterium]|jgi:glycosyltransferase involved in cell wall biosynthesis|nr:glycosyltransferase [Holosporaceae bacterium]
MKSFLLIFIFFIFEVGAKPKISVIIPVYNTERFLRECLDSILNQTFTDFEVICVNDASTDHCPEILREYADKDKRVRIVNHKKNAGMAVARNTGLDVAEGEYISFSDSDDYMHPDMLKIMYTEIRRNNCDLAICQWYPTNEYDKPVFGKNASYTVSFSENPLADKISQSDAFLYAFFSVWDKMYKKSAIASLRFDPQMFGLDDAYFNMCAARFIGKYVTTDAKLYGWRQYQNSCSKSKSVSRKRIKGRFRLIENIYNSSSDSIPLSSEQKRVICCSAAASVAADVTLNCHKNIIYASEQIYDLYSKGFIDISHSKGFFKKNLLAFFIIIGEIQKLFRCNQG